MKPVLYLRIASILTLVHAILHTVGGVFGKPAPGVATMVAATMRTRFEVLGVTRSYSDFYLGMGLGATTSSRSMQSYSGCCPNSPKRTLRVSGPSSGFSRWDTSRLR